jgi:hypothetical protein
LPYTHLLILSIGSTRWRIKYPAPAGFQTALASEWREHVKNAAKGWNITDFLQKMAFPVLRRIRYFYCPAQSFKFNTMILKINKGRLKLSDGLFC